MEEMFSLTSSWLPCYSVQFCSLQICFVCTLQLQCSGWWMGWFVMEGSIRVTPTNYNTAGYSSYNAVSHHTSTASTGI